MTNPLQITDNRIKKLPALGTPITIRYMHKRQEGEPLLHTLKNGTEISWVTRTGVVTDILPAGVEPDRQKVIEYYFLNTPEKLHKQRTFFRAKPVDRVITEMNGSREGHHVFPWVESKYFQIHSFVEAPQP